MEDPTVLARVFRCFGPAGAANNIHTAIAVDVARAKAVAGELARQIVLDPLRREAPLRVGLALQLPPSGEAGAGRQDHRRAIAQEIDDTARLGSAGCRDGVGLPLLTFRQVLAWMLDPLQGLRAPVDGDQVRPTIAVDIENLVGIAVGPAFRLDLAEEMLFPRRRLVPEAATNDVELAVFIYIHYGGCHEFRVGIDDVTAKGDVIGEKRCGGDHRKCKADSASGERVASTSVHGVLLRSGESMQLSLPRGAGHAIEKS